MTEKRFKHSEFQQDDGQYQYYGIEDTEKNFVYNVIGDGMYDVSEELLINILNELAEKNNELQFQCNLLQEQANEFHRGAIENANKVGKLEKENKELKQFKEQLFELIDGKIKEYQKYDGYDTEKYYIGTQLLKELKKELIE